jgi:hypothetical protein
MLAEDGDQRSWHCTPYITCTWLSTHVPLLSCEMSDHHLRDRPQDKSCIWMEMPFFFTSQFVWRMFALCLRCRPQAFRPSNSSPPNIRNLSVINDQMSQAEEYFYSATQYKNSRTFGFHLKKQSRYTLQESLVGRGCIAPTHSWPRN